MADGDGEGMKRGWGIGGWSRVLDRVRRAESRAESMKAEESIEY